MQKRSASFCRGLAVMIAVASLVATPPALAAKAGTATEQALDAARSERAALQARLEAVTTELELLAVRIDEGQVARARLEADVTALQAAAVDAQAVLAARALRAYKNSRGIGLGVVLAAGGFVDAVERARLLEGVGRHEREALERAGAARSALWQRRQELAVVLAQLEEEEAQAAAARAELAVAFTAAKAREDELASRRARQRRVSRGRQQGVYACPMKSPYTFRDTWGAPRSGGRRHKGVDIFAPMGQEVYAITSGVIIRSSNSRLGGLGLYLRGTDGNVYYYAHLQRSAPGYGPGRRVEAGELMAFNGDSGNARGGAPHVHFEVHPGGGGPVNPYPFVAAACR
jgi:peptidoglycan LD-endopeptidase LytH